MMRSKSLFSNSESLGMMLGPSIVVMARIQIGSGHAPDGWVNWL